MGDWHELGTHAEETVELGCEHQIAFCLQFTSHECFLAIQLMDGMPANQ
jgi:hypothetical protein